TLSSKHTVLVTLPRQHTSLPHRNPAHPTNFVSPLSSRPLNNFCHTALSPNNTTRLVAVSLDRPVPVVAQASASKQANAGLSAFVRKPASSQVTSAKVVPPCFFPSHSSVFQTTSTTVITA